MTTKVMDRLEIKKIFDSTDQTVWLIQSLLSIPVKVRDSAEIISDHDLMELERQLGFVLPMEYRNFLLIHNGGYPEPDVFPIHNNPVGNCGILHHYLCIKPGDVYDIWGTFKNYQGRIPPDFLPIAGDPGGNLLCLGIFGETMGQIYFWDHEEEFTDRPRHNLYFVADSFFELLDKLQSGD